MRCRPWWRSVNCWPTDRSDGGPACSALAEMAFTGHCGVEADIAALGDDHLAALFNEELGAVIQVRAADRGEAVEAILAVNGLAGATCITSIRRLRRSLRADRRRWYNVGAIPAPSLRYVGGRDHTDGCGVWATTGPAPIRTLGAEA